MDLKNVIFGELLFSQVVAAEDILLWSYTSSVCTYYMYKTIYVYHAHQERVKFLSAFGSNSALSHLTAKKRQRYRQRS